MLLAPLRKLAIVAVVPALAVGSAPAQAGVAGLAPHDGHQVTIVVAGPGVLTVDGWLSVEAGNLPVTSFNLVPNQDPLTAVASPYGSGEFAGWGGACSGTLGVCGIDMSEDRCLVAAFQPIGGPPADLTALSGYCPQALGGTGVVAPAPGSSPGSAGAGGAPGPAGSTGPAPAEGVPHAVVAAPGAPAFTRAGARVVRGATVVTGTLPAGARTVVSSASYLTGSGGVRSSGTCTIRRRIRVRTFTCRARTPLKGRWQVVTQARDAQKHVVGQATSVLTVR